MGALGTEPELGLSLAAEDHVADIGETGAASHGSSDGTTSAERARRYGGFMYFGECLWYGSDVADAKCMVLDLIIDDGVPSRGHRKGVFEPRYEVVGVAVGKHVTFGKMSAMEFAQGWQSSEIPIGERMLSGPVEVVKKEELAEAKADAKTTWKLGMCPICGEPIKGGAVVDVEKLGGKMHASCFKCTECECSLRGVPFQIHEKKPFCNPCYYAKYGEKCTACGEAMTGGMVKNALGKFHVECVICADCETHIGKGSHSTANGK